jgi:hypothetical protein
MVTTSLLEVNIDEILSEIEKLTGLKLPKEVIEVSLEPKLKTLCIRFKRPTEAEFGEPVKPGIHLFTDKDTKEITAIEIINLERLKKTAKPRKS